MSIRTKKLLKPKKMTNMTTYKFKKLAKEDFGIILYSVRKREDVDHLNDNRYRIEYAIDLGNNCVSAKAKAELKADNYYELLEAIEVM